MSKLTSAIISITVGIVLFLTISAHTFAASIFF